MATILYRYSLSVVSVVYWVSGCAIIAGLDPDLLPRAARNDDVVAVKRLLAQGASCSTPNRHGYFSMIQAANGGHMEVGRILLVAGAKVRKELVRKTIQYADSKRPEKVTIVNLLLKADADPNAREQRGITPLMSVCIDGQLALVC